MAQASTTNDVVRFEDKNFVSKSTWRRGFENLMRDKLTLFAMAVVGVLALLSLFAPFISNNILGIDYREQNLSNNYAPAFSEGHILGTDDLGRDQLTRLLYGGQVSLGIASIGAALSLTIGIIVGVLAGYYGGIVDDFIIWAITTLNSIPALFLLLIVAALLSPGPLTLVLVFGFITWTGTARLVRGETYSLKERDYVIAAKSMGASDLRVMFVHIVPNVFSLLVISLMGAIGVLILTESALSFLGLGIKPPDTSWGSMLSKSLVYIQKGPHLIFAPGILISVTVLCLYIIGDGLRDAFDPKLVK